MKNFLIICIVILLLTSVSGCVVSSDFLYRTMTDLRELSEDIQEINRLVGAEDFSGALLAMDVLNVRFDKINVAIAEAEQMGEDPAIISKIKSVSVFTGALFDYMRQTLKTGQDVYDGNALLASMPERNKEKAVATIDYIDTFAENVKELDRFYERLADAETKLSDDDSKNLGADAAVEAFNEIQAKYDPLAENLLKEKSALKGLYGLE